MACFCLTSDVAHSVDVALSDFHQYALLASITL